VSAAKIPTYMASIVDAGGKKIGKGFGRAAAMLGIMPQPYRVIDGG